MDLSTLLAHVKACFYRDKKAVDIKVPPSFVGYSNKLSLRNSLRKKAGGISSAVKQLFSQCGSSPHHVETSKPFHFIPTEKLIG
jgi:hypothetical protein